MQQALADPIQRAAIYQEYERQVQTRESTPEPFRAVGWWYEDFGQTSDEEVRELLAAAHR